LPQPPVTAPARFVPTYAVGFSSSAGELSPVSASSPLPVASSVAAAASPLEGTASTTGMIGPFAPTLGLAVALVLRGTWSGSVALVRSTDGGTSFNPLTAAGQPWARFTGNACEAVWEENDPAGRLYLDVTLASGSVTYRLGH
jgi:hypothetical protein